MTGSNQKDCVDSHAIGNQAAKRAGHGEEAVKERETESTLEFGIKLGHCCNLQVSESKS